MLLSKVSYFYIIIFKENPIKNSDDMLKFKQSCKVYSFFDYVISLFKSEKSVLNENTNFLLKASKLRELILDERNIIRMYLDLLKIRKKVSMNQLMDINYLINDLIF